MASVLTPEPTVDELIAQMQSAQAAPEPGTFPKIKDVISKGTDDVPIPIMASALTSAGYVWIYDRKSGERSLCNRNMLPAQLKKRHPQTGEAVFSVDRPAIMPKRGTIKCRLHPDQPSRAEFDAMGLPTCTKATLNSEFQEELHTKHRHPGAFANIESVRIKREKEEDRELQREFIRTVQASTIAGAGRAAVTASAPKKTWSRQPLHKQQVAGVQTPPKVDDA
mgnify:CR=1 FL=1